MGNVGDVNQVLLNLILNAAQAIDGPGCEPGARGTITVRTQREGDDVAISGADTRLRHPGRDRRPRLRPLLIARGMVVEGHGGALTCDSDPATSTTFHVRPPLEPRYAQSA